MPKALLQTSAGKIMTLQLRLVFWPDALIKHPETACVLPGLPISSDHIDLAPRKSNNTEL